MIRRKFLELQPEFGFRKIVESTDLDPDPYEPIRAMIAGPGTNLEGGSRVP